MDQTLPPRLPVNLESAVQRVRMAARTAAEHTVDSLGLAALASHQVLQRDALLGAQYELNRKLAIFALTFNEALDLDVARQTGNLTATPGPAITPDSLVASWESLTLVDDHEVEIHISADRFALEISHACEWEIRELDAYMGTLLGLTGAEHSRNPLRAEVIGQAMIRAVEAVADRPEVRKVLCTEIGRSLAHAMRQTYTDVVADLRHAGVRPAGLTVRQTPSRGQPQHGGLGSDSQHGAGPTGSHTTAHGHITGFQGSAHGAHGGNQRSQASARNGFAPSHRGAFAHGTATLPGHSLGHVDGNMMALIRRLAGATDSGSSASSAGGSAAGWAGQPATEAWFNATRSSGQPVARNQILAYRDELRQASSGALDHMVIDVIASLFDQILADAKVPPQVARQIARLQLPVLRAALGDNSFFSSRKHPVRRFINRIASLGTAVDDFDGAEGRALLDRVASLVQEVVDGDFEQIAVYEQKLHALEAFITAQAHERVQALGAADVLLGRKEDLLRVQQRFALELDGALQGLPVPPYLRVFLASIWSRAIASAAQDSLDNAGAGGPDDTLVEKLRDAGRELVMSVQPKGTPAHRQLFLRKLPQLMKDLNTGMDRIAVPEAERRQFFAQLLPAHAESLKGQSLSTLEHNLLQHQVDGALATPVPRLADLPSGSAAAAVELQALAGHSVFSPAEARAVGLLDEAAVDWQGAVDIDLGAEPDVSALDIAIPGLPTPEPVEPSRGKSLAEHVQIGFAYRMQLKDGWQQVRLSHVSPGRSFFVFTHGRGQRGTVSMTYRMLSRLCAEGRLRALENAYLLERATARARRQLRELIPPRSACGAVHVQPEAGRFARRPDLPVQARPSGLTPQGGAASGPAEPAPRRPLGGWFTPRR